MKSEQGSTKQFSVQNSLLETDRERPRGLDYLMMSLQEYYIYIERLRETKLES